jgi:5'-nucleotidase
VYWIGLSGEAIVEVNKEAGAIQSDFYAVLNSYISITPIKMDSTNYELLEQLAEQVG